MPPRTTTDEDSAALRHGRILILILTCGSLGMIGVVWWYYNEQKQATEAAATRELAAVADVEIGQIANWRRERISDGRVLRSSPAIAIARRALSSPAATPADEAVLLALLERMAGEFSYADSSLVDVNGRVFLRLRKDSSDQSQLKQRVRGRIVREAIVRHDVVLSDLSLETRSGRPLMSLAVPVDDLGAFILEIDPSTFLYPYLKSWPGPRLTAETLLVRREENEAVYLSRTQRPESPAFFRRTLPRLPPDSVLNAGWSYKALDYRGVRVLGTFRRIPDSPWFLIAKIDAAEVAAPLRRLGWEMAMIAALIGLANTAGAGLIWRNQRARIHREREALFYAVANDTPAYLWMASPNGESAFINRPLSKFLGIEQQAVAKGWRDSLHPDDAEGARSRLLECISQRRAYLDEFRVRRFDGQYRWVVNEGVPRFSPSGEFLGFAGALIDVTERTRKEQEVRTLTARLIGAQEEERKRLARELHDDLNQQIAALSMATGNLKRHISKDQIEARAQCDRLHQKLVQIAETVRRMSHELHPAVLEYSGLAPALRTYCAEFGALAGIEVSLEIRGSMDGVADDAALCIYRIAQEALRNVVKHAKVPAAAVKLERAGGWLHLSVSDRGLGMDPAGLGGAAGLGLVSIKERTRLVNGTVEIRSAPNQGTTILVKIPDAAGVGC